jgi:hypothetical protein
MKKKLIATTALLFTFFGQAQLVTNGDYRSMGMGGGFMFTIDDAALNTNPSLLGWQATNYKHKFAVNLEDFHFKSSVALADYLLFDSLGVNLNSDDLTVLEPFEIAWEAFESYDPNANIYFTYDPAVSRTTRAKFKDALLKNNTFKMRNTIIGATYSSENWGTFSLNISNETTFRSQLSEQFADFMAFGKTASYFDTLVLIDGSRVANEEANYQNEILINAYYAYSTDDSLDFMDILGGSRFEFIRTRNHSLGWGKELSVDKPDLQLFVGGNVNVIEGLQFLSLDGTGDGISMANFGRGKLEKSPFGNSGLGASISASATVLLKEKWMFGAGFNNLGAIRWKRRTRNTVGSYVAEGDNPQFENYVYGVSPTKHFTDQIDEANFFWYLNEFPEEDAAVMLPTASTTYIGVRRNFGKHFALGLDVIQPLVKSAPGSLSETYVSFNYQLTFKKFSLFSGINNGLNGQAAMPMGISFGSRTSRIEVGLSIADLLGYLDQNKTNNFSAGIGLTYRFY